MHGCEYVSTDVHLHVHVCLREYTHMHAHMHVCIHTWTQICTHAREQRSQPCTQAHARILATLVY